MLAFAYVNWGRWVADCPLGCGGAERPAAEWFVCRECGNDRANGERIPVVWPTPDDVVAIEAALIVRPLANRHWTLNESIGALLVENVEHGLLDTQTGRIFGDIGADHNRVPALLARAQLELTA